MLKAGRWEYGMKNRGLRQLAIPIQFLWGILGFLSVLIISYHGYQNGSSLSNTLKLCILSVILISIIVFYILSQQKEINKIPYFNSVFIVTYIASLFLIIFTKGEAEMHLWLIGGLAVALMFDVYLGYIVTYNLIFFASFIGGLSIESIVYLLVIGTLLCLLSNYMKTSATIGYVVIIVLSLQIVMLFIINSFIIKNTVTMDAVYSVVSSLLVFVGSLGSYRIYEKFSNHYKNEKVQSENTAGIHTGDSDKMMITESFSSLLPDTFVPDNLNEKLFSEDGGKGTHTLDEISNINFSLIERLRMQAPKVYKHSLFISELSGGAAKIIGADDQKARVGGLYHEIGRLEGKQYIEEGLKLAEEYHLPDIIRDMIKQHNLKYEKPKTKEAAIVMMTVSFIATKEYLEKTIHNQGGSQQVIPAISNEKIVDNLFQLRLSKGSLDESGLTINEFNQLKEFYLHM